MAKSSNAATNPPRDARPAQIEDLVGFLVVTAVSVGAVFVIAGACSGIVDQLMRYGSIDLIRAMGGVI